MGIMSHPWTGKVEIWRGRADLWSAIPSHLSPGFPAGPKTRN